MSGNTTNQGYPYPVLSDFADVQDAFRLAQAVDSDLRAAQGPMRSFMARPSFIARQTANSATQSTGGISMSVGAIDWDNTGGVSIGGSGWVQPLSQGPSWWLFGATLLVNTPTTPVLGDLTMAEIKTGYADPITGVLTETVHFQRNDDSNTAGEWINTYTMAQVNKGYANLVLKLNGSTAKGFGTGSRFFGLYLGPVT